MTVQRKCGHGKEQKPTKNIVGVLKGAVSAGDWRETPVHANDETPVGKTSVMESVFDECLAARSGI